MMKYLSIKILIISMHFFIIYMEFYMKILLKLTVPAIIALTMSSYVLANDATKKTDAAAKQSTEYFKLTTLFREGENECLEGNKVGGSMNGAAFMDKCQNVSGQLWKKIPAANGYFKLTTQFREGENECLEGNKVGGSMNGAAFMDKCQDVSGQLWKEIPAENGSFKLTTQFRENKKECLEGNKVGGSMNGAAFMDKCQDVSGQIWKIKQ